MNRITRFFLMSLCGISLLLAGGSAPTKAEALFKPSMVRKEAPRAMPVLEGLKLEDNLEGPLFPSIGTKIYDRCMSRAPAGFTPEAHSYYCTCSSAAIVGNFSRGELMTLQNQKNWVAGHKTFEKYVKDVIVPCLDVPVDQVEYLSCAMNTHNDARIGNIPRYCKCVKAGMGLWLRAHGAEDIIIGWRNGTNKSNDNPVTALWDSDAYQDERDRVRSACAYTNRGNDPFEHLR